MTTEQWDNVLLLNLFEDLEFKEVATAKDPGGAAQPWRGGLSRGVGLA